MINGMPLNTLSLQTFELSKCTYRQASSKQWSMSYVGMYVCMYLCIAECKAC